MRKWRAGDDLARLMSKVDKSPTGCWLWTAGFQPSGYGLFSFLGRNVQAHRSTYELLVGPIPEGLQLDHLCRNRACVNPDHLEPVTQKENLRRGEGVAARKRRAAEQTHCIRGHEFTEANTQRPARRPNVRVCRACRREKARIAMAAKRTSAA